MSGCMRVVTYRLRNPADPGEVYGDDFAKRDEARARARQLADFYRHTVEVCQVVGGHLMIGVQDEVEPGPDAPAGHELS